MLVCEEITETRVWARDSRAFKQNFDLSGTGEHSESTFSFFDVITSLGKLDRGSEWKNVTSHAQGRES